MNITNETIFKASPRLEDPWTPRDYAFLAGKIVFAPITALYYVIRYLFSHIVYAAVVAPKSARIVDESAREELKGTEVHFQTQDGVKLEGMHIPAKNPNDNPKTILLCLGSGLSYEHYAPAMVDALIGRGHNVFVFNYRGYGRSEGSPSQEGFNLDAEAAYQYLQKEKGVKDEQMVVLGYSMGSAPATDLAAHHKINLVLDRYFSAMHLVAHDRAPKCLGFLGYIASGIFHLGDADFDIREKIKKVAGRILLVRGEFDPTMLSHHEQRLRASLKDKPDDDARFFKVNTAHHHSSAESLWFHHGFHDQTVSNELTKFLNDEPISPPIK